MSRSERYNARDLTYSAAHRSALPQLYARIGHRADAADRDWTEYCHFCKKPLAIYEEVRDRGQDLTDKATTVTRWLARMAGIPASLVAWRTARPPEVQREIDELNKRVRELEGKYPITGFTVRPLYPEPGPLEALEPGEHWRRIALVHAEHEAGCHAVPRLERARLKRLRDASKREQTLWDASEFGALCPGSVSMTHSTRTLRS